MKTATKRAEPPPDDTQQAAWDDERLTDASRYARRLTASAGECKARKAEARQKWAESRQAFLEAAAALDEHAAAWCANSSGPMEDRSMFATAGQLRTAKEQKREVMLQARQQFFLAKNAYEVAQHKAEEFYDPAKSALPLWDAMGAPTPPLDPVAETLQDAAGEEVVIEKDLEKVLEQDSELEATEQATPARKSALDAAYCVPVLGLRNKDGKPPMIKPLKLPRGDKEQPGWPCTLWIIVARDGSTGTYRGLPLWPLDTFGKTHRGKPSGTRPGDIADDDHYLGVLVRVGEKTLVVGSKDEERYFTANGVSK